MHGCAAIETLLPTIVAPPARLLSKTVYKLNQRYILTEIFPVVKFFYNSHLSYIAQQNLIFSDGLLVPWHHSISESVVPLYALACVCDVADCGS